MPILFIIVAIDLIGFGIVIPILPFIVPGFGGDEVDIALIIAVYSVFAGICGPLWGKLSDRIGRKPVILICISGAALSYVFMALATELWMLYAARIFCGMMAGNFGTISAMIGDISTPEKRARSMGLIGSAFGIGMMIGPFIGGVLSGDDHQVTRPAIAAATMSILAIIAGIFLLKESLPAASRQKNKAQRLTDGKQSILKILKQSHSRLLVLQYFLHTNVVSSVMYLFPLMIAAVAGWGPAEVGMVFGLQGVVMLFVQGFLIHPLAKHFGELKSLLFGISLILIGFSALAFFADTAPSIVTALLIGVFGATICMPMLNSLTSKRIPAHYRGRVMGTAAAMGAWGRVFSPLMAGSLLTLGGFTAAWSGCIAIAILYISWVLGQLLQPDREQALPFE